MSTTGRASVPLDRLPYLSLSEAADLVGVGRAALDTWLYRTVDPLPVLREGRRIVVVRAELDRWTARNVGAARSNADGTFCETAPDLRMRAPLPRRGRVA